MTSAAMGTRASSGGVPVPFDRLVEGIALDAEAPWLRALRKESFARLEASDRSFGRYSRSLVDWASLALVAPDIRLMGGAGVHASAGDGAGLRVEPLSRALLNGSSEALRPLMKATTPWDDLVLSGWREGAALRWDANARGEGAQAALCLSSPPGLALTPLLLDVAEGAEASLFVRWNAPEGSSAGFTAILGRVGDGAKLQVFLLHDGESAHRFISSHLDLGRDASVEFFGAWMGGRWTLGRFSANLSQPGASWRETHLILASGREHLDLDSQVRQNARATRCDVQVRTVAGGDSRAVFTGNILMDKGAVQSEAQLADHVLLLSRGARADAIPGLEIKASSVKAAHAASVGQVDPEQIFYLQSRGLSEASARHLIVAGFLKSLLDRAPMSFVGDLVEPLLESKVTV